MPTTIKLTKCESGFSNIPAQFTVGDYDDGSSHLVSCKEYTLPDGYHVAECKGGSLEIYDDANRHHEIIEHSSGRPQLVGARNEMPVLAEVKEDLGE